VIDLPKPTDIEFMKRIESEYKRETKFVDRSQFKIFYTPIWQSKIAVLGINPAG
jgi:hypothetical protein